MTINDTTSPRQAEPPPRGSRLGQLVRIVIGLGLLAWVLGRADWGELLALLGQVDVAWLVLFVLITPVSVGLSVWKWQLLLSTIGHRVRFLTLFLLYVLSQFYNNLLPSSVGGDVVRVMLLGRRIGSPHDAFRSVLVERFTGLTVLITLGMAAIGLAAPLRQSVPLVTLVLAGLVLYGAVVLAVFDPRLLRLLERCCRPVRLARQAVAKLQRMQQSLWEYRHHPGPLAASLLLALAFHLSTFVTVYLACRALGQPVPWSVVAAVTPVALVVTLLPISFNGLGVREWAFVVGFELLSDFPGAGTLGLAASLLVRFKQMIWSSTGLLVYLCLNPTPTPTPPATGRTETGPPSRRRARPVPDDTPPGQAAARY
ncbi:MAG: lysylphosphatidylglycerol synthase transmembrane domain-containing protein [Phycisphaeraceae bacterium]